MSVRTRGAAACLALAAAVTACGGARSATGPGGATGTVTVLAAASLREVFGPIAAQVEAAHPGLRVVLSYGASSTLAAQVRAGAPADVLALASAATLDGARQAGDVRAPKTFATNAAQVAVSPRSAARVRTLADLARADVAVELCAEQVPCGALAASVLARAHVQVRPVTRGLDVSAVLRDVTSGEVDAGVVYATDVRSAGSAVIGVEVPAAARASTSYPIAVTTGSHQPSLAQLFVDAVLAPAGQQVLARAGFGPP